VNHPLDKTLAKFKPQARIELLHLVRYFDRRIDELTERINQVAIDLTKLNDALTAVQNYVKSHQDSTAADQAAADGVAAQIVAAVTPAPVTPPATPAAS
jgi:uncharacterized coiled-coil protein SlyX